MIDAPEAPPRNTASARAGPFRLGAGLTTAGVAARLPGGRGIHVQIELLGAIRACGIRVGAGIAIDGLDDAVAACGTSPAQRIEQEAHGCPAESDSMAGVRRYWRKRFMSPSRFA
ncbi:MAG: hypothetical protein U5K73_09030 [Halofilum sp. (in: g-proteobacteria)]|nr:hypothetical protein [Halofilum sp. (in: g-proteobacteria)]